MNYEEMFGGRPISPRDFTPAMQFGCVRSLGKSSSLTSSTIPRPLYRYTRVWLDGRPLLKRTSCVASWLNKSSNGWYPSQRLDPCCLLFRTGLLAMVNLLLALLPPQPVAQYLMMAGVPSHSHIVHTSWIGSVPSFSGVSPVFWLHPPLLPLVQRRLHMKGLLSGAYLLNKTTKYPDVNLSTREL